MPSRIRRRQRIPQRRLHDSPAEAGSDTSSAARLCVKSLGSIVSYSELACYLDGTRDIVPEHPTGRRSPKDTLMAATG